MYPRINKLPQSIIDRIAAGEVIERPSSVVKELIENSIDANATNIRIDILDGGKKLIRVSENGRGIHPEDLELALTSHATSKIGSYEDLFKISTLGFRGEALASISSVSLLKLSSRTREFQVGREIVCRAGTICNMNEKAQSTGTIVEVSDLFYNVPARHKFLKSQTVEFGYILDIFTRFAIAFPGTSWELYHNNELIHKLDNAGNVQSRIAYFFGQNILNSLQSINMANDKAKLEGLISNKSYFVSHLNYVYFFINGRPIKDRFMLRAVQEGYKELLPPRRNPAVFLFLTIPPDEVDMNVHPAKLEVRIRNVWNIAQNISDTIRKSLGQHYDIPQKTDDIFEAKYTPATDNATKEKSLLGLWESYRKIGDSEKKEMLKSEVVEFFTQERTSPKEEQTKLDIIDRNFIKITQLNDTFILEEKSDGIAIIDQHALHERLLYYDIKQKFQKKEILSQKMLLPLTFDVSPQMAECLEELIPMLTELGFEIGLFGQKTYAIHAAPDFLNGKNPVSVIRAVVENTSSDKRRMGLLDSVLATLSCRAAVKAGDKLNDTEIGHILNLKNKYRDMSTCPHGRPTEYFISWDKLERFFDRK